MNQPLMKRNNNGCLKGIENDLKKNSTQKFEIPKNYYYKRPKLEELGRIFEIYEPLKKTYFTFQEGYIFKDLLIELMEITQKNRQNETEKKAIVIKSMFNIEQDKEEREFIKNGKTFLFLKF